MNRFYLTVVGNNPKDLRFCSMIFRILSFLEVVFPFLSFPPNRMGIPTPIQTLKSRPSVLVL